MNNIYTSANEYYLFQGFAYGKLLEEKVINSYPGRFTTGVDIYKNDYDLVSFRYKNKNLKIKKSELFEKFKKEIDLIYREIKESILREKRYCIDIELNILENYHKKGSKPKTHFEKRFEGSIYFHNGQEYKIEHLKENRELTIVTYVVELKSGKKHTVHMSLKDFQDRDYFKRV